MGDIQAEVDSIKQVAAGMTDGPINTATQLKSVLEQLDTFCATNDWSTVPSCQAFGASYNAAVKAYLAVAKDLLEDATKMQGALQGIAANYNAAEERSVAAFNAHMAALGTQDYMTQSDADAVYRRHHGDLHSDDPEQAPERQPDAATGTPTPPAPTTTRGDRATIG